MAGAKNDIPQITTPSLSASVGGASGIGGGGSSSNRDLMADARASLEGNWGWGILGIILYYVLSGAIYFFVFSAASFVGMAAGGGSPEFTTIIANLITQLFQVLIAGSLMVGLFGFFLWIAQENETQMERLFVGFKRFWASLGTYLIYILIALFFSVILCALLGVVSYFSLGSAGQTSDYVWAFWPILLGFWLGSIYPYLTFFMAFLCIADDEDCGVFEAFRRSKQMMKGNKWKFFCLHWRFLGWSLIASFLTFGIGYLWLIPYFLTSFAKFYEDVK